MIIENPVKTPDVVTTAGTTPEPAAQPATPTPETPKEPAKAAPSLADLIRQDREDRATKARQEREAADWRTRAEAAEKRLKEFQSEHDDLLLDPVGFTTRRGLTPEQRAIFAQELLYDLVPDRATPEHRAKLVEHQLKRQMTLQSKREAERAQAEQERREREQMEHDAQQIQVMARNYAQVAETWTKETAHPFPTSHAWFADEPDTYHRSLLQTAANLARTAQERGETADLSPRNVARVLEEHLAKRASRLTARPAEATETPTTSSAALKLPPKDPNKPLTEAERIARATQVVFQRTGQPG